MIGIVTITTAFDTHSAISHTREPQSAPSATTETKYALKTAVKTTVVYPEFAKSYPAHERTSRGRTPGFSAEESKMAMRWTAIVREQHDDSRSAASRVP